MHITTHRHDDTFVRSLYPWGWARYGVISTYKLISWSPRTSWSSMVSHISRISRTLLSDHIIFATHMHITLLLARCALFLLCFARRIFAWPLLPMIFLSLLLICCSSKYSLSNSLSVVTYPFTLIWLFVEVMCLAMVSLSS